MDNSNRKKEIVFVILILLGSLAVQLYEIDEPWVGLKDYNGAAYGIISRNFVKHGFTGMNFGTSMRPGPLVEGEITYYLHHPPVFYYLVAVSYNLFGVHEWSARLVPILFSILALFFFFRLVRKIWGVEAAYYSSFFLAFLPMNSYFSRIVLQESAIMLGVVLLTGMYVRWRETRRSCEYWKLVAIFFFFGMIDWPAYYLLPLFTLHTLIVDRGKESVGRMRMFLLPLFGLLLFSIFLGFCFLIAQYQGGAGLLESFIFRSAVKTDYLVYSFIDFFKIEAIRSYRYFTPFVLILSACWVFSALRSKRRDHLERELYAVIFLLFGLIHVFLWKDASWIHEFWMFHLSTGLCLTAGLAILRLKKHPWIVPRVPVRLFVTLGIPLLYFLFAFWKIILIHQEPGIPDQAVAGMIVHEMSEEDDRVIIHWEEPVPEIVGHYFRYLGSPIYTKPIPYFPYYSDLNIRWGVRDLQDMKDLLIHPTEDYRFFVTKISYFREGMSEGMKRLLEEQFEPLFMLNWWGTRLDHDLLLALLMGETIDVNEGLVVFGRKAEGDGLEL